MKNGIFILFLAALLLFSGNAARATASEGICLPENGQQQDSGETCLNPDGIGTTALPERSLQLLLPFQGNRAVQQANGGNTGRSNASDERIILYFFRGKGCPHCEEEIKFLGGLKRAHPSVEIRDFEVWYHKENAALMALMLQAHGVQSSGVPVTFVHDRLFTGFTAQTGASIEKAVEECKRVSCGDPAERLTDPGRSGRGTLSLPPVTAATGETSADMSVTIPLLGRLATNSASLPLLTLFIAGMDSFNPCAFFVLLSLLGLLTHARSRHKMLLVGGIFVFFSGFIYFLFMAAWLNLFLVMGHVAVITMIAGCVSLLIAGINIKDFFLFKRGVSLTIPDSAKPKLFDRMRKLLRSDSLAALITGTTVLALVANSYELLCTAGFPMVFTRLLTLNNLSTSTYYLYLVLYNIVYVVPLFLIVLGFTLTLGKRQLSEWQGRFLKLVSGVMMLGLGAVLLINPALLNSVMVSFGILATALGVSLLTAALTRRGAVKPDNR